VLDSSNNETSSGLQADSAAGEDEREALVETIKASQRAIREAASAMVSDAIAAGEALRKLKRAVSRGGWGAYLRHRCDLSERTAQVYMRLAEHRAEIEADPQRAADLSLRSALKLIGSPPGNNASAGGAKSPLSVIAWINATLEQRCRFVNAIGLPALLEAIPLSWHSELEHRVDGRRAAASMDVNQTLSKALRLALSFQKTATDRDNTSHAVASALNGILAKAAAAGLDINDLEIRARKIPANRRRAA
jgi:hypothetical protein